jgi:hypothetical protein
MANQISEKLALLTEYEGFDDPLALAEESMFGSGAGSPGICMNEGCDYTTNVEPDSRSGWCEECETNTVWSVEELLLEGGI